LPQLPAHAAVDACAARSHRHASASADTRRLPAPGARFFFFFFFFFFSFAAADALPPSTPFDRCRVLMAIFIYASDRGRRRAVLPRRNGPQNDADEPPFR